MASCCQFNQIGKVCHSALFTTIPHLCHSSRSLVDDASDTQLLEKYWEEHKMADSESGDAQSPQLSPFSLAQRKQRALSSATLGTDERQTLPAYHPALSLCKYVDVFGPLIFPLHRAALLRKRILIVTAAPVRDACEFGKLMIAPQAYSTNQS